MISNVSSGASTTVQQYPAAQSTPLLARAATSSGDTVELSDTTQRALTASQQSVPQPQPTLHQLVEDAANGDISALARLSVIG